MYSAYTRKHREPPEKVNGYVIKIKEGWKTVCIHGSPYDRGFAHGFLLHEELARTLKSYPFLIEEKVKYKMKDYIAYSNKHIKPVLIKHFPEIYEEMEGIVAGANAQNVPITLDFLIAWNSHMSIVSKYIKSAPGRCSAFIATGSATEDGKIVMGHTTHTDFITGQLLNIVMYVIPHKGVPFIMQTSAGYVASVADWFVCSSGIIGCETTIWGTKYEPQFGYPFFCRIRTAMQYATTLDEYAEIMQKNNAGDYACSWLFGDIHKNEIMLCEIGLNRANVEKTGNGIFYGMNSTLDFNLRTFETVDDKWNDIAASTGSRGVRLNQLLYGEYFGRINVENAKKVLSDHYNPLTKKEERNHRAVCVHAEFDGGLKRNSYAMRGCTDCKVITADMAKDMAFYARFGAACGRTFSVKNHVKKHPKYKKWGAHVRDFKKYKWTKISFT